MLDRETIAGNIVKLAERSKLQLHPGRNAYMWADPVRKKGGKLLLSVTACVGPSIFLHKAYHCLMVIAVGGHVYSFSAHSTVIPDLVVLFSLVVGFALYLLDIGHFELQEPQRILNEVGK